MTTKDTKKINHKGHWGFSRIQRGNLRAVLGEFPPSESTRLAMEKALSSVDLVDYVRRDPLLAVAAIGVMASQAPHVGAELRRSIQTQLLATAVELDRTKLESETRDATSDSILAGLVGCSGRSLAARLAQ